MPGLVPAQPLRHASGRGRGAAGAEQQAMAAGMLGATLPLTKAWLCR
jgi:hypothetical protein